MTKNFYKNSIDYNNDLDAFESRVRAEAAESEPEKKCICLEIIGDNGYCPVHGNGLEKRMEEIKADYFTDYGADYQESKDLWTMGNGG